MRFDLFRRGCLTLLFLFQSLTCLAQEIQFDSDVVTASQVQMKNDLKFVESIVGIRQSPLNEEIFGRVSGVSYLQWFTKRVLSIGLSDCGSSLALACQDGEKPNRILLTPLYSNSDYPQILRILVLFHEARHTEAENDHWLHANCPKRFSGISRITGASLARQPACDSSEFGSYGVGAVLLHNIAQFCVNCSEKVKSDAELYAQDNLERLIDEGALKRAKQDFSFR